MTDPLITAARFLTAQLPWLRHATDEQGAPVAADVFREIGDCAARLRRLVNGPSEQRYLGPCGAPTVEDHSVFDGEREWTDLREGPPCEGDVYGVAGAQTGRCRTCGATVDQAERRQWLDDEVRQHTYTAAEIAAAYPGIKANTIRQWLSRGLVLAHGEYRGRPLLNLGEVLDLAAADAARREEARVTRDRRKTATLDVS